MRLHVVEIRAAVRQGYGAESVEVEEVGAFEMVGAIEEAGGGDVPEVNRPEAEGEDEAVGAQALGGEEGRVGHSSQFI